MYREYIYDKTTYLFQHLQLFLHLATIFELVVELQQHISKMHKNIQLSLLTGAVPHQMTNVTLQRRRTQGEGREKILEMSPQIF